MPSVNALEQYLFLLQFWQSQREYYRNTRVDQYTRQYIAEQLAECEQRIADLQTLTHEQIIAWAARRPPPPQQ